MSTPENYEKYKKNYSDTKLWDKFKGVAKKAGIKVVYASLLLYYVVKDPTVSAGDKAIIYGALGYFILPIDLIPDAIPLAGYTDDLTALVWALKSVWINVTPKMQKMAKSKLYDWFGEYDEKELDELW